MILKTESNQYMGHINANDIKSSKNVICTNNLATDPRYVHLVSSNFSLAASNATGGGYHIGKVAGAVSNATTINIDGMTTGAVESLIQDVSDGDTQILVCGDVDASDNIKLVSLDSNNASAGTATITVDNPVTLADDANIFIGPITGSIVGSIVVPAKTSLVVEKTFDQKLFTTPGKGIVSGNNTNTGLYFTGVA